MALTLTRRRSTTALVALAAAFSWIVAAPTAGGAGQSRLTAVVDPALRAAHGTVGVIVSGTRAVESAVVRSGGSITHDLPIINGFAAKVPASDISLISRLPGVTAVTLDRTTQVQSVAGATNTLPSVYKTVTRGDRLAKAGGDGSGVTVALIDTGVTALPDIANSLVTVTTDPLGQVTASCINMSGEPTCDDTYGHGTFMAGIIAGNGAASAGKYVGMAPGAKVLSVKIAGATGASDVSTIIAAIQWVVSFKAQYGIRVLNLSLGTDSTQSYSVDPLDYAVERAWQSGIVVNVAASNRGPSSGTIADPANDPFVVTVGAIDDKGTNGFGDDVVPNFSGRGPTSDGLAKPDIVAPGAHIVSLAAPGASVTTQFPSTMAAPYRRGSGTAMATAVVSGLVAQMLSLQPTLTPDRVKYELTSTAHVDASNDVMAVGTGVVDGQAALAAGPGVANVGVPPSTGTGSIAASRGTVGVQLADSAGTVLDGSTNLTAQLTTWDPTTLQSPWTGGSWFGGSWFGGSWFGGSWFGGSWFGGSWFGGSWFGQPTSTEDYGGSWFGGSWFGAWDQ
jgi:subtilisin family serine protease